MLQIAPDAENETENAEDDPIFCAGCGHLITRERWAISMDGHERVFINPAGRVFRIRCFDDAPGAANTGDPTKEHSWFPGYAWNFALCRVCDTHLGWQFVGDQAPRVFFGLIKTALTTAPSDSQG